MSGIEDHKIILDQAYDIYVERRKAYGDASAFMERVAGVCGMTREQVALVFLATKMVRSTTTQDAKDLEDTLLDLINYSAILLDLFRESKVIPGLK